MWRSDADAMTGEIVGSNQSLGIRDDSGSAARQGASIAFNHTPRHAPNVNPSTSAAAAAALFSTAHRHAEPHRMEANSEPGPEVGSVKDKIGRLNANALSPAGTLDRGRKPIPSLAPSPGQIAARVAASRSPERKPEPASDAARLGALRSAARAQPQASIDRRELRSPIPLRPSTKDNATERMLHTETWGPDRKIRTENSSVQPAKTGSGHGGHDEAPSPQPLTTSAVSSTSNSESKPQLPPRSAVPSIDSIRKAPLTDNLSLRASTPSTVSRSSQPHHSNSSIVDEFGSMNEESLSNAIVASSLASSRASPATVIPPPPPARRRARSRSILQLTHKNTESDSSRTPSPPKGMLQTLRGMPSEDDTDPHRRHRFLHKHPHKHHEGDRKRWRQEITEKERKRYEGVWASNKGLFIPPGHGKTSSPKVAEKWPPPNECVLNLVVREIWCRSRLPTAVLGKVWDLVDHRQIGLLTKEEFVVGMWLIDQQLKGHKLPVKVPESVWDSVRYVTGIKLSSVT